MDEELNRAIDTALDAVRAVKPAPDFLPRLRAHVEHVPPAAPIRWWIPLAASASAVAAGVVVAALLHTPRKDAPITVATPSPLAQSAPAVPIAPTAPRVAPASEASSRRSARAVQPVRPVDLRVAVRALAPERHDDVVLVPPGQLAALGRLIEAINAGDEHAASMLRKLSGSTPIVIEPIQIEPVAVPPLKESM